MYEENTTGTATYIYGPTGRLAKRTTINEESDMFYYHTDHLGSTRLVTDDNRNIVLATAYHPFGDTSTEEGSENYLFNGKEKDATGLYYYGARYYDPDVGRFLSRDPLKGSRFNSQSLNRYSYCLNNPMKFIDPWGEKNFYIEGGGIQEEPEVTGDPSYNGNGQITIPTSMGDVTIDLDTENWGNVDDKAKQNQVKEKFGELQKGRQKFRELYGTKYNPNYPSGSRFTHTGHYSSVIGNFHSNPFVFSFGIEFIGSYSFIIGAGYGYGFVIDSNGDFEAYSIEQISNPLAFTCASGDASIFYAGMSADEVANSESFTAEGSPGYGFGANFQISGPVGGGVPNKFNLGGGYTKGLSIGGAWHTKTSPL